MKIAMISSGNSIHVKKIANALVERGYEIILFTLPNHNKLLSDFDKRITVVTLPVKGKFGYFLNASYIRKYLKKHPVDLVNSHYASGYGTLSRYVGFHPLALAVFGSDVYEYPFRSKLNMKTMIKNLNNADIITSTSNVMVKKVREFYDKDKEIYVTPFGVDINRFHPIEVEKDDVFEFGIVKKIEPKYGIDILIKAYKKFCGIYPEAKTRLCIYGRGSALDEYKNLADSLGLNEKIQFKGFIQNELVPEVLSHMDVAVYSSSKNSESFGVAVVEAMACGIPVIASDASGFTEVMEDGKTGFLFPMKDIEALVNCMVKMYEMTPEERKKMSQAGIERVRNLYDFSKNMDTYELAIGKAIKSK